MRQKVHHYKDTHTIELSIFNLFIAALIFLGELVFHELEMPWLSISFTVGVFFKDVICDLITKCEDICNAHNGE